MLHVKDVRDAEYAPTPNVPNVVDVAPYDEVIPYAKPLAVEDALPSDVIVPFNVTDEVPTEVAELIVTVGTDSAKVVNVLSEEVARLPDASVEATW